MKDSLHQTVGTTSGPQHYYWGVTERVLIRRGGELFTLAFDANGFKQTDSSGYDEQVYFTGPNCTGTPMFPTNPVYYTADLALVKHGLYNNGCRET